MAAKNISTTALVSFGPKPNDGPAFQMFLGETILSQASVVRYNDTSNRLNSLTGTLYITNFKIAFICSVKGVSKHTSRFSERFSEEPIDCNDLIPLTSISNIYGVSNMKQKRKKLKNAMIELLSQFDILEIETKDFRVVQYDFKLSGSQNKRSCFQMIFHYAFPTTVFRLFAFDYGSSIVTSNSSAFYFLKLKKDYELNISRLHASQNWRVTDVNEKFAIGESLPKFIVCPASLDDNDIEQIARSYVKKRFPVWIWSDPSSGCSILISSHLRSSSSKDPRLRQTIPSKLSSSLKTSSTLGNGESVAIDLNNISDFPSLKQLQISFQKIHKSCTFHSSKGFWSSDSSWLSSIEETRWLHHVSSCLKTAKLLAKHIQKKHLNVLIEESTGHDFSILVASLVQIMLDPYYRTHLGLKALIQKDWVLKGHPFSTRLGTLLAHSINKSDFNGQSPVFLLFFDCLHQLINQYPVFFEYTDLYLVLVMDCAYSSLFETFIFDSEMESEKHSKDMILVSVWDFLESNISEAKFQTLFTNLAFKHNKQSSKEYIYPLCKISDIVFWSKYFLRWLSIINEDLVSFSGIVLQLQQNQFNEEVEYLTHRLMQLQLQCSVTNSVSTQSLCSINQSKKKR